MGRHKFVIFRTEKQLLLSPILLTSGLPVKFARRSPNKSTATTPLVEPTTEEGPRTASRSRTRASVGDPVTEHMEPLGVEDTFTVTPGIVEGVGVGRSWVQGRLSVGPRTSGRPAVT